MSPGPKKNHEFRDPIHNFITLDSDERRVVDSRPFQRLRHIHQLALTYLIYPGATHKRFEHSLGVMELAGKVYDVVTKQANLHDSVRGIVPEEGGFDFLRWRRALRMAALCHDIGHLPFSHAAEKELLPDGWSHERLTVDLIHSPELGEIWGSMGLSAEVVAKLAVGQKELKSVPFTTWESILSEIVVGDAFGVDRMDYLLRDSHHLGVRYGQFDHHRLIDTLRILPREDRGSDEPDLGLEKGGLPSAEALMYARYFMYKQVYFHPIRRIYDLSLRDFMSEWLGENGYPTDIERHLSITDVEVTSALLQAARDQELVGRKPASIIVGRNHSKLLYEYNPSDSQRNSQPAEVIFEAARSEYGEENVKFDSYDQKGGAPDFPVQMKDGRIESSLTLSEALLKVPLVKPRFVYVNADKIENAKTWLDNNRDRILRSEQEETS